MEHAYICIDLKSYYASVECVARGLDPLKARLLVADESRSDQTICLAVSPALKAMGVPGRPRLFEAKQAIRQYEALTHTRVDYITAVPRMALYEKTSALIYSIYLRFVAPEDVHVYSVDECFIDCTAYLHFYEKAAEKSRVHPAHQMAMTMIRDVLKTTGITATVGIGTNMYLAKVAMDIVAKKRPADRDGVRIAELNESPTATCCGITGPSRISGTSARERPGGWPWPICTPWGTWPSAASGTRSPFIRSSASTRRS